MQTEAVPVDRREMLQELLSRYKLIKIDHNLICALVNGELKLKKRFSLPENSMIVGVHHDPITRSFVLHVCCHDWPRVRAGAMPEVLVDLSLADTDVP